MDKQVLVSHVIDHLKSELQAVDKAARATFAAAVHPESSAEDKYDTRGLETSYLAGAQANRVKEIRSTIGVLRAMSLDAFGPDDDIRPGALVELEDEDGAMISVLVVLAGGGFSADQGGRTVRLVTPSSPLGGELVGLEAGDDFELELPAGTRRYQILSVR